MLGLLTQVWRFLIARLKRSDVTSLHLALTRRLRLLELAMPPRPHLAYRGRFGLGISFGIAGLGKNVEVGGASATGVGPPGAQDRQISRRGPERDHRLFSAIVAGEIIVFLALVYVVMRGTN